MLVTSRRSRNFERQEVNTIHYGNLIKWKKKGTSKRQTKFVKLLSGLASLIPQIVITEHQNFKSLWGSGLIILWFDSLMYNEIMRGEFSYLYTYAPSIDGLLSYYILFVLANLYGFVVINISSSCHRMLQTSTS